MFITITRPKVWNPRFITWGLIRDLKQIDKFETLVINIMEVEIHVSEEELAEFPEEATDSTGGQGQSGKTSQTLNQGIVQSLLFVRTSPTPSLLKKIKKGYTRYIIGESPRSLGGSISQYK